MDKIQYGSGIKDHFFPLKKVGNANYSKMIDNYITAKSNQKLYYLSTFIEAQMLLFKDILYFKLKKKTKLKSPLVIAAIENNLEHIRILVECGECVNKPEGPEGDNNNGETPLYAAARRWAQQNL